MSELIFYPEFNELLEVSVPKTWLLKLKWLIFTITKSGLNWKQNIHSLDNIAPKIRILLHKYCKKQMIEVLLVGHVNKDERAWAMNFYLARPM